MPKTLEKTENAIILPKDLSESKEPWQVRALDSLVKINDLALSLEELLADLPALQRLARILRFEAAFTAEEGSEALGLGISLDE
ncbi:MAG: hypothetical protein ABSH53_02910 [Holophaga sp.]|jgi:DNA-directed RNA polymerase specialized sigma24 family protein